MFFTVNNSTWQVCFVNPGDPQLQRSDGTYTLGVTDNNLKTVFMCNDLSNQMIDKVLCHELTHVHAMEYGYSIPIETEEIVADFISLFSRSIVTVADELIYQLLGSNAIRYCA